MKEKKRKEKRGETDTVKKKLMPLFTGSRRCSRLTPHAAATPHATATPHAATTPHASRCHRFPSHTQTGNGHTNAATVAMPTRDPS